MAKPRNEAAAARVRACAEMGFTISQTCKALSMSMAQADRYAKSRGFTFRDGRRHASLQNHNAEMHGGLLLVNEAK